MGDDLGFNGFNIVGTAIIFVVVVVLLRLDCTLGTSSTPGRRRRHERIVVKFLNVLGSGGFGLHNWVRPRLETITTAGLEMEGVDGHLGRRLLTIISSQIWRRRVQEIPSRSCALVHLIIFLHFFYIYFLLVIHLI